MPVGTREVTSAGYRWQARDNLKSSRPGVTVSRRYGPVTLRLSTTRHVSELEGRERSRALSNYPEIYLSNGGDCGRAALAAADGRTKGDFNLLVFTCRMYMKS